MAFNLVLISWYSNHCIGLGLSEKVIKNRFKAGLKQGWWSLGITAGSLGGSAGEGLSKEDERQKGV
jgi:hypothetical protein